MLEYLVVAGLAFDDLQQRHKASVKKGQRLNPHCQWITYENKDCAEKRDRGISVKGRIGIPATEAICKDIVDPWNVRDI